MRYLEAWKRLNPQEYDYVVDFQRSAALGSAEPASERDFIDAPAAESTAAEPEAKESTEAQSRAAPQTKT